MLPRAPTECLSPPPRTPSCTLPASQHRSGYANDSSIPRASAYRASVSLCIRCLLFFVSVSVIPTLYILYIDFFRYSSSLCIKIKCIHDIYVILFFTASFPAISNNWAISARREDPKVKERPEDMLITPMKPLGAEGKSPTAAASPPQPTPCPLRPPFARPLPGFFLCFYVLGGGWVIALAEDQTIKFWRKFLDPGKRKQNGIFHNRCNNSLL